MDDIYIPAIIAKDSMITDQRPKPETPAFADDPRPALVLENVVGLRRRRNVWQRVLIDPVSDLTDRLVLAARSIS